MLIRIKYYILIRLKYNSLSMQTFIFYSNAFCIIFLCLSATESVIGHPGTIHFTIFLMYKNK